MASLAHFFLVDNVAYDEKAAQKHLRREIEPALAALHDRLAAPGEWSAARIEAAFEAVRSAHGDLPLGKLAQPVRVAITGGVVSPPIFDTLEVLGPQRSLGRIAEALHFIRHG